MMLSLLDDELRIVTLFVLFRAYDLMLSDAMNDL